MKQKNKYESCCSSSSSNSSSSRQKQSACCTSIDVRIARRAVSKMRRDPGPLDNGLRMRSESQKSVVRGQKHIVDIKLRYTYTKLQKRLRRWRMAI